MGGLGFRALHTPYSPHGNAQLTHTHTHTHLHLAPYTHTYTLYTLSSTPYTHTLTPYTHMHVHTQMHGNIPTLT
jgi:hypothetical protein